MSVFKSHLRFCGILSICCGLMVITAVISLKSTFGYPEIIRANPDIILQRLYDTRNTVPFIYYFGIGGSGLCLIFFSILLGNLFKTYGEDLWASFGKICGIISGLLLYIGIIRYSILFPKLAALRNSELYNQPTIDLIFIAFNTYAGESIAEHSQFLFTALMLCCFGISACRTKLLPFWLAIAAFCIAVIDIIGNLEHFGYTFAFFFNRTGPKLFAVWLIITGIYLLIKKHNLSTTVINLINH